MARRWTGSASKPSRSDEVMDSDQQIRITNRVRSHFDSIAPKRPAKPYRSESSGAGASNPNLDCDIPELRKLRSLQSETYIIVPGAGDLSVENEFVETQYYKVLDSVDKLHHTTGSGFIRVVNKETGNGNEFLLKKNHLGGNSQIFKSNPARNDWISGGSDDGDDEPFVLHNQTEWE